MAATPRSFRWRIQLATAYRLAGELVRADEIYRETLELLRSLDRERSAYAVAVYSDWGLVRGDLGDILGARRLIESAAEIGRALRPDGAADHVIGVSYAKRLLQLGRFEEAEGCFSQARVAAHAAGELGLEATALLGTVAVKREQQDLAGARAALHGAEDFIKRRFPASHRARSSLLFETGLLYLAQGAFSQAATVLEDVTAHYSLAATSSPDELLALTALTQCEIALGNTAAAVEYAERARTLASRFALPGQPSYWVGYCLLVQAQVEVALDNRAAARALAANALEQLVPSAGKDVRVTRKATEMAATP